MTIQINKECWVYAAQINGDGPMKIGSSAAAELRVQTLQAWTPYEITLRAKVLANVLAEDWLHGALSLWRIRGEWYLPSPEVISAINYMSAHGRLPFDLCAKAEAALPTPADRRLARAHDVCAKRSEAMRGSWLRKRPPANQSIRPIPTPAAEQFQPEPAE